MKMKTPTTGEADSSANAAEDGTNKDIILELFQVLEGQRSSLIFYSHTLECDICLVNTALADVEQQNMTCPVYTTDELAYILTLSQMDLKRYHYLKSRTEAQVVAVGS